MPRRPVARLALGAGGAAWLLEEEWLVAGVAGLVIRPSGPIRPPKGTGRIGDSHAGRIGTVTLGTDSGPMELRSALRGAGQQASLDGQIGGPADGLSADCKRLVDGALIRSSVGFDEGDDLVDSAFGFVLVGDLAARAEACEREGARLGVEGECVLVDFDVTAHGLEEPLVLVDLVPGEGDDAVGSVLEGGGSAGALARPTCVGGEDDVADEGFSSWNSKEERVGPVGLEPTTRGLKVRCSAN